MLKNILVSWKTTGLGLIAGALQAHAGGMNWKSIGLGLATTLLGALAKDNNVTGGDTPNATK